MEKQSIDKKNEFRRDCYFEMKEELRRENLLFFSGTERYIVNSGLIP